MTYIHVSIYPQKSRIRYKAYPLLRASFVSSSFYHSLIRQQTHESGPFFSSSNGDHISLMEAM